MSMNVGRLMQKQHTKNSQSAEALKLKLKAVHDGN